MRVSFEEFYENVNNIYWKGWKDVLDVMEDIEALSGVSKQFPDSPIKHAISFLNNWLREKKIREIYGLEYNDPDRNYLTASRANFIPAFVDYKGRTVDFCCRRNNEHAFRHDWNPCNCKLFFNTQDKILYKVRGDKLVPLRPLLAERVDPKKYRLDKEIQRRFK